MISHWTATAATSVLKNYLGITSASPPSGFYLAMSSTAVAGGFTELAVANYSRKPITWTWSGNVYATNATQIDFPNLGAATLVGQAIFDAPTGGNQLFYADLDIAIGWATGHTISYPVGVIKVGLTV